MLVPVRAADVNPAGCPTPPPAKALSAAPATDTPKRLVLPTDVLIMPVGGTQQLRIEDKDASYQILNAGVASVSAGTGDARILIIKGERQGDTRLRVSKPDQCVDVGIIVKPPNNRFVLSVGVGTSSIPKRTINIVPSSPDIAPVGIPAAGSMTVNRVVLTEDSKSQATSFSALGHIRITDNTYSNFYGTLGALGADGGVVYGVSYGANDALFLTVGLHSSNVTDFAPGYFNNAIVPTGVSQVTLTRRQTGIIVSLSVPISILGSSGFLGAK